jgi:hypothetical protein
LEFDIAHLDGEEQIIECITFKYISKKARYHNIESIILECPSSMFATGATSKIATCNEDLPAVSRIV